MGSPRPCCKWIELAGSSEDFLAGLPAVALVHTIWIFIRDRRAYDATTRATSPVVANRVSRVVSTALRRGYASGAVIVSQRESCGQVSEEGDQHVSCLRESWAPGP